MPDVRMPDGTIIRNVPEGTTKAELQRKLAAHGQGAPKPKSWGENLWQSTKNAAAGAVEFAAAVPDAATDAMAGAMRYGAQGVDAVGGAGLRAIGADGAADSLHRGAQMADKAWSAPAKIGNIGAKIAPEPTDTAGKVARFGAGMIAGAGLGAAASKAPTAIRTMLGAPPTPPVPRNALAQAAGRNTAAKEVVEAGKKWDVPVFTTDLKKPGSALGQKIKQVLPENIPLFGMGGKRAGQQGKRVEAVRTALKEFGGEEATALFDNAPGAMDDVVKNLTATRGAAVSRLTGVKTAIKNKVSGSPVSTPLTVQAIDGKIAELQGIDPKALGPVIQKLEDFKANILTGKNMDQIEEVRKMLGSAFDGGDLASVKEIGQKAVNAIYAPLRNDITNFIRTQGGDQLAAKWTKTNDTLAAMMGELNDSAFKKVLRTAEMTPENVAKMLFSKDASTVSRLISNLDDFGKSRARAALVQKAFDKSVQTVGGLSVETFVANIKSLSKPIGVAFEGADKASIEGLTRLLDTTRRAAGSAVSPATGAQSTPIMYGYGLSQIFGAAAIPVTAVGALIARAYESAPVRNLLVGLAKTQPGSKAESAILKRIAAPMAVIISRESEALSKAANSNVYAPLAASQGSPGDQQQQDQQPPQP